ncbi:MAG: hypothetical protein Q8L48_42480 [Archangium sp.]|nr:hypothetical protein [Archangium sp.]
MTRRLLVILLLAGPVMAQADLPDAGLPDAAVGGTGAERDSEEEDATLSSPCLSERDCDRGFACNAGKCTWRRYREATYEGCGAQATTGLFVLGAALLFVRRRYFLLKFTK